MPSRKIVLKKESFISPEILFQPQLIELNSVSIDSSLIHVINNFSQTHAISDIYLTGGVSLTPGISRRLLKQVSEQISNSNFQFHVESEPILTAWREGCRFSIDETFQPLFISKHFYQENGFEKIS
jgi:actin-related protein